jgi:signal transduction histidine kinase
VVAVSAGLRDLLFDLESADTTTALPNLLREAADHLFENTDLRCTVSVDTTGWNGQSTLSPTQRGQALRIVKEALINTRKHANAEHVLVRLVPGLEGVEVAVSDDGVGFDVGAVSSPRGHRGLANMRDRAAVSGGWCRVESDGQGATVRFWVPYDDSAPPWMAPEY